MGVAGRGRIRSPLFKTGIAFDEFRARALAIMLSDGNLTRKYQLRYTENNRGRVEYVKRIFKKNLGQIDLIEDRVPGDVVQLKYPAVVGRIFEQWGMPKGNKLFQNVELPNCIKEGSERVRRAYLEELVPEEGYFHVRKPPYSPKFARFVINRVRILDGGENPVGYDLPSLITPEHVELIREFGKRREHAIADERQRTLSRIVFTWGRLKQKAETVVSLSTRQPLCQLEEIIENNPPNLLRDEKDIITSLGIQVKMYPERIILYNSGQVSVAWRLETWRVEDTIKWAVIAPPSSGYKRKRVQEWLELHREKAQRFRMLFQEK